MTFFGFLEFGIKDMIETLLIAGVLYYLYTWVRGTFAISVFVGLIIIFSVNAGVSLLGLTTINFILMRITDVGILALVILFQPEIRKLLYRIGQNTKLDRIFKTNESENVIDEVVDAVQKMAAKKVGALIIFAKAAALQDMTNPGQKIDAVVSSALLRTIFQKDTPLHDGAVVIREDRIVAAGCLLTLSQNPNISSVFGTRHRAAVGVSETNNVFVVAVSEETGRISVATNGSLTSGLSAQKLRKQMHQEIGKEKDEVDVSFTGKSTAT